MDWKGLSEMEREEYLPDGKNDKKRSFESFTSRERVWSAKRFSVWKSLKEIVRSIIYSSLIVSDLLNHVYATVVLVFYCEKETGFMQIHHPGAHEEENPVSKYVQCLMSNLS